MNPHGQPSFAPAGARQQVHVPVEAFGDQKGKAQTYQRSRAAAPVAVFMGSGILLLGMLCIVPIWNAVALMEDPNYAFWEGRRTPTMMVALCVGVVATYVLSVMLFFGASRHQAQTEQTIMMIASIFITVLGLGLMLMSLPLSRQAIDTYNNLMHRCEYSEQTHRMYEYSQVLQNIRAQPACAGKYSVEECEGYEDAKPYTEFLKVMENEFHCSGFCYQPTAHLQASLVQEVSAGGARAAATAVAAKSGSNATSHASAVPSQEADARRHGRRVAPVTLLSTEEKVAERTAAVAETGSRYPPSLFSDANYQASCEGMAARDMKNFAGDVSFQTFYQGVYLLLIAIATGFLRLLGTCVRQDDYKGY